MSKPNKRKAEMLEPDDQSEAINVFINETFQRLGFDGKTSQDAREWLESEIHRTASGVLSFTVNREDLTDEEYQELARIPGALQLFGVDFEKPRKST
jgi:hypothetical protein